MSIFEAFCLCVAIIIVIAFFAGTLMSMGMTVIFILDREFLTSIISGIICVILCTSMIFALGNHWDPVMQVEKWFHPVAESK